MARAAINMLLKEPARAPEGALEVRVSELEGRLHMLALEIKKINQHHTPVPDRTSFKAATARLGE